MKKLRSPTPRNDPATFATISVGSVAGFIAVELKRRAGIEITLEEGVAIVLVLTALFHYVQGKVKA